jgi:3-dehydroquinate synthetase
MLGDKKRRGGRQRWILPMEIGRVVEVDDVTDAELRRALRAIGA